MSEPIPESIPTSADPRSNRPTKRRALTPRAALAHQVSSLFAKPDKPLAIPSISSNTLTTPHSTSAPPEIVANVQGSSAGAGSGEFHVYKASRRREYERLRAMDDEVQREGDERDFLARRAEQERRDAEKTERNRGKRAKALARRKGKGTGTANTGGEGSAALGEGGKRKFVPSANVVSTGDGDEEGEKGGEGEIGGVEENGLVIEDDD